MNQPANQNKSKHRGSDNVDLFDADTYHYEGGRQTCSNRGRDVYDELGIDPRYVATSSQFSFNDY